MNASDIDIVSTHATGTTSGDVQEADALRQGVRRQRPPHAAEQHQELHRPRHGRRRGLELAGNLPAFDDGVCHATINLDRVDPDCAMPGLVANQPREMGRVRTHPQQLVRHAGDQFRRHRATNFMSGSKRERPL